MLGSEERLRGFSKLQVDVKRIGCFDGEPHHTTPNNTNSRYNRRCMLITTVTMINYRGRIISWSRVVASKQGKPVFEKVFICVA